jgi:TetR/AcrR family tetracycline transcriptional repressor
MSQPLKRSAMELDPGRIAAAALAVADAKGAVGFTMRAVAQALGVTPMALYHHVEDKAALAALLVDAAIGQRPLPPPTGVWQDDLWTIARWMRDSRAAHPAVAHIRRAYRVWTGASLEMTERWLGHWRQSGLAPDKALIAATTSSLAIVGIVEEESVFRDLARPADGALSQLPGARQIFEARHDRDAEFELLVRALIDGLHARLLRG